MDTALREYLERSQPKAEGEDGGLAEGQHRSAAVGPEHIGTTHVIMVIDSSGSMHPLADDVRGGFNGYRRQLVADTDHRYLMTVIRFSTGISLLAAAEPPDRVPDLTDLNYAPSGATALYDAVGLVISWYRAGPDTNPADKVLLFIQTDGQENQSTQFTLQAVLRLLDEAKQAGWSVVFAGQGPEGWAQRESLNLAQQSVPVPATSEGTTEFYAAAAASTKRYASGATRPADLAGDLRSRMQEGSR